MSGILSQKVALITGATQGIGLALTRNLLTSGWIVFGTGRDESRLEKIKDRFPNFNPIPADFTKNDDIKNIASIVKNTHFPLQLLVQNAGMKAPPCNLEKHSCEIIDDVFSVNLLAPMKLTALLTPYMPVESRILFITSRAATLQLKESATYCASKAGLNEVSAIVRQEVSEKNIGVASVIPGEVDTKIQKILRETKSFHLHEKFQKAFDLGQLIKPEICANFLQWFLCDLPFEEFKTSQIPTSIYDKFHHNYWLKNQNELPAFPM